MNGAEKYEKLKLINSPAESHSYITIETTIDISIRWSSLVSSVEHTQTHDERLKFFFYLL